MNTRTKRTIMLAAALVAATAAFSASAQAKPAEPQVPDAVAAPDGHKPFLVTHAVGVQIYTCDAAAGGYAWRFVAPRADLYGDNGKLVATHFGGPTWQARDGSTVVAGVAGRAAVDPGSIPWLLLAATSTAAGDDGDRLTRTTYIQRLATTGGLAPAAAGCNESTSGVTAEVPYTADYVFWKTTGS